MAKAYSPPEPRFWSKAEVGDADVCWPWTGTALNSGYGNFWVGPGDLKMLAHRYAYETRHGPVPVGQVVMHTCDNKLCVNPAHLRAGSSRANSRDMTAKCRMNGGAAWRLTADQVAEIRARFVSGSHGRGGNRRALAVEFGIDVRTVWKIATGRSGDYRLAEKKARAA